MAAQEHKIETILDIAALPPEKREACCHDLLRWCALLDLAKAIGGDLDPRMVWVDDGKHDATIQLKPFEQ